MKKIVFLVGISSLSIPAMSQTAPNSSMTFYGVAEAQFGSFRNLVAAPVSSANPFGVTASPTASIGAIPYGINASRFGIKGVENLGNGMSATFVLETQNSLADGSMPARLFHRQANIGLTGGFGQIRLGRIYSAWNDVASNAAPGYGDTYDPFVRVWRIAGPVPLGPPVPSASGQVTGLSGAVGANNVVGDPNNWSHVRMDNSIRYDSPNMGGVTLSAQVGMNDPRKTITASTFAIVYARDRIRAGLGYFRQSTASNYDPATQRYDPNRLKTGNLTTLTGAFNYDFGAFTLVTMAGQSRYDLYSLGERVSSTEWSIGASVPLGQWVLKPSVAGSNSKRLPKSDIGAGMEAIYNLSKRTSLYAAYSYSYYGELLHGQPVKSSYIFATGVRHFF